MSAGLWDWLIMAPLLAALIIALAAITYDLKRRR